MVWNAFFLHALLYDFQDRSDILILQHNSRSHSERLRPAIIARNLRMVGPGQRQWSHACNKCTWFKDIGNGGRGGALIAMKLEQCLMIIK